MHVSTLVALGLTHTRNALAETAYIRSGVDVTRPVAFYGLINERCNVKCRYCEFWRLKNYAAEMTMEQWKAGLFSIRDFVGPYTISLSGGEPFIRPGFLDLLKWCSENGINAGVTTNGSALTKTNAAKVVAARPVNVNISVDAPDPAVHDYLRGYPGLFDKLSQGIRHLLDEQKAQRISFPIVIKPTIGSRNFRYMPALVEWATEIGATGVNFQPMNRWTPETYDELWIEKDEAGEFQGIVDRLIEMAKAGAKIITPPHIMALYPAHFREEPAPRDALPCRVGLQNFFIRADGIVMLCDLGFDPIGDLKTQSAREIWYGPEATRVRKQTTECERLCLITCLSQKTLVDKVRMGTKLFKRHLVVKA